MRKFKTILTIIMILSLCLGLCACGAEEQSDERLKVRLKGDGSSKLKLTVFIEPPEGCQWEVSQPESGGNAPFTVTQTKSSKGTDRYKITANREGSYTLTLAYKNQAGESYASVQLNLDADAKHKISCSSFRVTGRDEYKPYEDENFGEGDVEISNYESSAKDIKLITQDGIWMIGDYDKEIILPEDTGLEEGYSTFRVTGLKIGVSSLVLYNPNARLQLQLELAVTEDTQAMEQLPEGEKAYVIRITGTHSGPYDETADEDFIRVQRQTSDMIAAFIPEPVVSDDAIFRTAELYRYAKPDAAGSPVEYKQLAEALANAANDEEKAAAQKALDKFLNQWDSLRLKLEYQNVPVFCTATKAQTLEKFIQSYTEGMTIASEQTISLRELEIACKITPEGMGLAFFEKDGFVWSFMALEQFTPESFEEFITEYVKSAE